METPPDIPDLSLLRRIGGGSYGDVWIARTVTGVYRAVKVVDKARFADDRPFYRELDGITRFQRSVGDQPRQLALMHVGRLEERGIFYYVMELADDVEAGTDIDPDKYEPLTLKALHEKRPVLPAAEVIRIGSDLARSLVGMHEAGLIHRDVKPSNIIFVAGVPKLADIGLVSSSDHTLTSLGTPGYSPPEGAGTVRADIFSLGKILYLLATGLHTDEFPKLPKDVASRTDARTLLELNEVYLKACQPDPNARYESAQAMLDELMLLQAGRSVKELNHMRERLRLIGRAALWLGAAAAVVIAVLGVKNYFAVKELAATEQAARIQAEESERLARYTANLHVAQLAFNSGDYGLARSALRRDIPLPGDLDLRGPEWRALWNDTAGNAARQFGNVGDASASVLMLSPTDGRLVSLRGAAVGQVLAWDLATGQSQVVASGVRRIGGFLPDGSQLALGFSDGTLRTATTGTWELGEIQTQDVELLRLAGNGRAALLGRPLVRPTELVLWDLVEQLPVATWQLPADRSEVRIARAMTSPARRLLAVQLQREVNMELVSELVVREWGAASDRFRSQFEGYVSAFAFSQDEALFASAAPHQPLRIVNAADGSLVREHTAVQDHVTVVAFSPGGGTIACAGMDGSIRILGAQDGDVRATLRGHEGMVETMVWAGEDRLFSGSADGTVREWKIGENAGVVVRDDLWRGLLDEPVLAPDGGAVIVRDRQGSPVWLDAATLEPRGAPLNTQIVLGFAQEGLRSLDLDRELVVVDVETADVRKTGLRLAGASPVIVAAVSDEAEIVVLGQADGTITLWDAGRRAVIAAEQRHENEIYAVAVSPTGSWAISGDSTGVVWLWRPRDRQGERQVLGEWQGIANVELSPDDSRAVLFTRDGAMIVWRLDEHREELRRIAHPQGCVAAVFSPDNRRLFTGGYDGMVLVWSVPEFRQLAALTFDSQGAGRATICSLTLAADGGTLYATTEDGRLRRWDLRP